MKYLLATAALLSTTTSLFADAISGSFRKFQHTGDLGAALVFFLFMTVMAFKCFESALWRIIAIVGTALGLLFIGLTR